MSITCPQCHTRCRLKVDTEIIDTSQGKCPECGHIFIIPPGTMRRDPSTRERSGDLKKTRLAPGFNIPDLISLQNLIKTFGKTSFVWFFSGLGVAVICTAIFFGPCKSSSIQPQPNLTSKQSPPKPKTLTSITLSTQAKAQAIAHIKHHALVSDADISICNNQLQLALLVASNTPATYAERLGRQFAHYLKEQLKKNKQASQEMLVKVSVYYPGGTRIEVAINNQSGEEEVLPKRNGEREE